MQDAYRKPLSEISIAFIVEWATDEYGLNDPDVITYNAIKAERKALLSMQMAAYTRMLHRYYGKDPKYMRILLPNNWQHRTIFKQMIPAWKWI